MQRDVESGRMKQSRGRTMWSEVDRVTCRVKYSEVDPQQSNVELVKYRTMVELIGVKWSDVQPMQSDVESSRVKQSHALRIMWREVE